MKKEIIPKQLCTILAPSQVINSLLGPPMTSTSAPAPDKQFISVWKNQGQIQGGTGGLGPQPPEMRPQHQNSTKLRPQNGSFRPLNNLFFF